MLNYRLAHPTRELASTVWEILDPPLPRNTKLVKYSTTYPTMVPTPTSVSTATPATLVKSSGAEDPAAMKVAPATSSDRCSFSEIASKDGTKKSSHIMARAEKTQEKYSAAVFITLDFFCLFFRHFAGSFRASLFIK